MDSNILGIDVGEKRVGVAFASGIAKLPRPLLTLPYESSIAKISKLVEDEGVKEIVVGMPLNRNNETTEQSKFTQKYIDELNQAVSVKISICDEALSSKRAKIELQNRKKAYQKEDIDALAATYILEDYLIESGQIKA